MELKTLKDFKSNETLNELQQEAIKWAKYYNSVETFQIRQWIGHFFNLKGEDLK